MTIIDFKKFKESKEGTEYKEKLSKMDSLDLLSESIPVSRMLRDTGKVVKEERLKARLLFEELIARNPNSAISDSTKTLIKHFGLDRE
jgi:hypothetical protein